MYKIPPVKGLYLMLENDQCTDFGSCGGFQKYSIS